MKRICSIIFALLLFFGCIKNDIPYPIVVGNITAFEVEGQLSCNIDNAAREVNVEIGDGYDLENLKLLRLEVTNDAKVTPDILSYIDLSTPFKYTLTTYQDYEWTINATQSIKRVFRVENQIGESLFDLDSRLVLVTVSSSQDLSNIKVLEAKLGMEGSEIIPDPYSVKDFTSTPKFSVIYKEKSEIWSVIVIKSAVNVVTGGVNAFAKYAYFDGEFISGGANPTFEYKQFGATEWIKLDESKVTINGGKFSAVVEGLAPKTEYLFRAVVGESVGQERSFVTEDVYQIVNSNFEDWYKEGKTWFPAKDLSDANFWWDSGNTGTNTLGEKNPTLAEENVVVKGKAAKLASTAVIGVFAAGNIYTGRYVKTIGIGAQLDFGKPFKGRPKGLKGYFNYAPGVIDKTKSPFESLKGQSDSCHIYAILTDWSAPFEVNTTTGKFVDLNNDPAIIAKCELIRGTKTNGYEEFTLDFKYRSLERKPNYIVICAAASKYGDYFTGSTSTVLYIDEFELVY